MTVIVRKHLRKGKNNASVVRKHNRKGNMTHRTRNGHKEVFVDGIWKRDSFGAGPSPGWSEEHLLNERQKLTEELNDSFAGVSISPEGHNPFPARKFGILTRRIKKINRLLKQKGKLG